MGWSEKIYELVFKYFQKRVTKDRLREGFSISYSQQYLIYDLTMDYLVWLEDTNRSGIYLKLDSFKYETDARRYLVKSIHRFIKERRLSIMERANMEISFDESVVGTAINNIIGYSSLYGGVLMAIRSAYTQVEKVEFKRSKGHSGMPKEIEDMKKLCLGTGYPLLQVLEEIIYPLEGKKVIPYELKRNVLYHFKKLVSKEYERLGFNDFSFLKGSEEESQ